MRYHRITRDRLMRFSALISLLLASAILLSACGPYSTYYRDSEGGYREPKPADSRLPYDIQQGEYYHTQNLWPYATRGPMNFFGKYRFSHKWFVVRGTCGYIYFVSEKNKVGPDGTGRGRGFKPRPYSENVLFRDIVERNGDLVQEYRNEAGAVVGQRQIPAHAGKYNPKTATYEYRPVCELDADDWTAAYSSSATSGAVFIDDKSFEQQKAQNALGYCSKNDQPHRLFPRLAEMTRPNGRWQGCVAEFRDNGKVVLRTESWTLPLADTGYHIEVVWRLGTPVMANPDWYEERRRAFLDVLDSVKMEPIR